MTQSMMVSAMEVDVHEAKTHLFRLLERVAMGEEVVIAKAGTPVAKRVPISSKKRKFRLGSAQRDFVVPDDFNQPDREIEDLFLNEGHSRYPGFSLGVS